MNAQAATKPVELSDANLTDSQIARYMELTDSGKTAQEALAIILNPEQDEHSNTGNSGGEQAKRHIQIEAGSDDLGLLFGQDGIVENDEIESNRRPTYKLSELGQEDEHGVFRMFKPIGLVEVLEWQRNQAEGKEGNLTRYYSQNVRRANPFVFFGKEEFGWVTASLVPSKLIGVDGTEEWNGHILLGTVTDDRRSGGDVVYQRIPISRQCSAFFTEFSNEVNRIKGTDAEMTKGRVLGVAKRMFDQRQGGNRAGVNASGQIKGRGAVAAQRRMMAVPEAAPTPGKDPVTGLPVDTSTEQ